MVPGNLIENELEEHFSEFVIRNVLSMYGKQQQNCSNNWKLNLEKVALFVATKILENKVDMLRDDFMREWRASLPKGVEANAKYLSGIAITIETDAKVYIKLFLANALPQNPKAAFRLIFQAKPAWMLPELEVYMKPLLGTNVKKADLLRKYTRSARVSMESDTRVFTRR